MTRPPGVPSTSETDREASAATARGQPTRTLGSRMASADCRRTGCHSEASDWLGFCSWCLWCLLIGAWPAGCVQSGLNAGWTSGSHRWTESVRMGRRCRSAQSGSNPTHPQTPHQQSHQGLRGLHPSPLPLCAPLHLLPPLWLHPGCSAPSGSWAGGWTGGWRETESQDSPHGSSEKEERDQK